MENVDKYEIQIIGKTLYLPQYSGPKSKSEIVIRK